MLMKKTNVLKDVSEVRKESLTPKNESTVCDFFSLWLDFLNHSFFITCGENNGRGQCAGLLLNARTSIQKPSEAAPFLPH